MSNNSSFTITLRHLFGRYLTTRETVIALDRSSQLCQLLLNIREQLSRSCMVLGLRLDESAETLDWLRVLENLLHQADCFLGGGDQLVLSLFDLASVLFEFSARTSVFS